MRDADSSINADLIQEMLLFKDKINYKMPHGNGFAAHLDAPAYDHISKIEHLTANLAVDEATLENGCLEVVPGSHQMDVPFSYGGHITKEWEDSHEWLVVPLKPGDILLFGSHLAHRSGPNNSDKLRSMIYATYAGKEDGEDLREKYYADRRVEFPPDHSKSSIPTDNNSADRTVKSGSKVGTTRRVGRPMLSLLPSQIGVSI
jgi:2-aminoethylphosphonate dioxygenase